MRNVEFSLYLITDRLLTNGRPLTEVIHEALQGGVKAVQLREKDLSGRALFSLASELRRMTAEYGAKLFISDRIDVALAVGADGVHLGIGSLPVTTARQLLGPQQLIGYSAHSLDEACKAETDGADFITFGPVYSTLSKAAYGAPVGVDALRLACSALTIPVFALGGIKHENIHEVMAAGACGIALIFAIIAASAPRTVAQSMLQSIEHHVNYS